MGPEGPSPALIEDGRFFLPGPTEVHASVLQAQSRPLISHRGSEMQGLWARLQEGMQGVLGTSRPVWISTSSATAMMEAAVRASGAERVLCLIAGAFSRRFARIAEASGILVERLEVEPHQAHAPDEVAESVARVGPDLVTMVHCETSTGVLNPVADLAAAIRRESDALIVADSVSGAGGLPVHPEAWGVDFFLTGSQKALAVPPGLAFGVVSPRFVDRARQNPARGLYLDPLVHLEAQRERGGPMTTPAISCLFALAVQLDRMESEGLEERFKRHREMQADVTDWMRHLRSSGLEVERVAADPFASPTVSVLRLPPRLDSDAVVRELAPSGYAVGRGYGEWRDGQIRIGHMGDHTRAGLGGLLEALTPAFRSPGSTA
ncbi:MAG: alanine--glyoxylate aminotransferase family protein [Gemmatimonadetes bacterium]|nr:alanine--glyoxylate aminotransferase family protein [Gemmatimonadota bacterium]